jgi:uncharacterized DUF497 family protein
MLDINSIDGFDWDEGNRDKNWLKHLVSNAESEELFFNLPLIIAADIKHSELEERYFALGQTSNGRLLFVSFTIRMNKIRVISARDMSQKERERYAQANS